MAPHVPVLSIHKDYVGLIYRWEHVESFVPNCQNINELAHKTSKWTPSPLSSLGKQHNRFKSGDKNTYYRFIIVNWNETSYISQFFETLHFNKFLLIYIN